MIALDAYSADELGTPHRDDILYPDDELDEQDWINLGKVLFFDPRLSGAKTRSCATCHNPDLGLGDGVAITMGLDGKPLSRHTPSLYNMGYQIFLSWDGRSSSLEAQALDPIQSKIEMDLDLKTLVSRLKKVEGYKVKFKELNAEISAENIAKALAAFQRDIVVDRTAYDRYVAGDRNALSEPQKRGLHLFKGKANCIECHSGPNFSDQSYHKIGVKSKDLGRYNVVADESLKGAFKTPTLRNVALHPPYMHNGSEATLTDVVKMYNMGGRIKEGLSHIIKPLHLNAQEEQDLVEFMNALTQKIKIMRPAIPK